MGDFSFIEAIAIWRSSNSGSFSPVTNPVCPAHTSSQMNNCVEFVTKPVPTTAATTTPAGLADVANALAEAGVDNSDKQLSMTLVWYEFNDLDIHAFQPDGEEIYWRNPGPLSSTGRLDKDSFDVGSNGLAVENIAWTTAPSGTYRVAIRNGGGQQNIAYKLYVQIDGVTSVYEGTAPTDSSTKYEVVSFVYSPYGRSVKGAVDFHTSMIALPSDVEDEKKISL